MLTERSIASATLTGVPAGTSAFSIASAKSCHGVAIAGLAPAAITDATTRTAYDPLTVFRYTHSTVLIASNAPPVIEKPP